MAREIRYKILENFEPEMRALVHEYGEAEVITGMEAGHDNHFTLAKYLKEQRQLVTDTKLRRIENA